MNTQLMIRAMKPDPVKFGFVSGFKDSYFRNKPLDALWTSTYLGPELGSDWVQWCLSNEYSGCPKKMWWLLEVGKNAKIYTLGGEESWINFCELFAKPPLRPYDYKKYIDWALVYRAGYHGVHLTEEGNRVLHSWYDPDHILSDLNCWDVESTCWLRWAFVSVKQESPVAVPVYA